MRKLNNIFIFLFISLYLQFLVGKSFGKTNAENFPELI